MKKIKLLVLICLASLFVGCGSASNNDQGVSFTLLGFFQDSKGETGLTGTSMSMSEISGADAASLRSNNSIAFIGLMNGLTGQYIRVQRVYLSYDIPGATATPPTTTFPLGGVISPAPNSNSGVKTTLPAPIIGVKTGAGNPTYSEVAIVTSAIREWMNFNRAYLPEPPFDMEVTAIVQGVTSAGDLLDSNPGTLWIHVTPDAIFPTPAA